MKNAALSRGGHGARRRVALITATVFGLLLVGPALAYKPSDQRKIAAPNDTAIKLLVGYDSRTGAYKEQCIRNVNQRTKGASPDADSVFKIVSSVDELTKDRSLDVSARLSVNLGVGAVSGSVDTSFEEQVREKLKSKAAYARYTDLAAPVFVSPNARLELNQRGQEAMEVLKKGRFQKFERECGDSVLVGYQKGREFRGVGTLAESSSFEGRSRDIKTELAARYMLSKMSASVSLSQSETREAKDLQMEISYTASGDTRVQGAHNFRKLRQAFEEFSARPLRETQTYRFVYVVPYKDILDIDDYGLGLGARQMRKVETILNGLGALQSALNTARADVKHGPSTGRVDARDVKNAAQALNRELNYLKGKMRESKGCLHGWSQECDNLHARFSNFPDIDRPRWADDFMRNAYGSPATCPSGFVVTHPSGKQLCQQCALAKEPSFLNGAEAKCRYIAEGKPAQGTKRLWAEDLIVSKASGGSDGGNNVDVYPDVCNREGKGCGEKAATRLCREKGLGEAALWEKWDWRSGNPIHATRFRTQYANGKLCREGQNDFVRNQCRTFKYIDCAAG